MECEPDEYTAEKYLTANELSMTGHYIGQQLTDLLKN